MQPRTAAGFRSSVLSRVAGTDLASVVFKDFAMDDAATRLRVFVVEDSPIILKRLVAAIEEAGAELAGHSDSAPEAIAALASVPTDVVIIDIQLRSGTGFDVLRALQDTTSGRSTIKIVLTNHPGSAYRERSFQLGATMFYDKSSESRQAIEFVHQLAARRRMAGKVSRNVEASRSNHLRMPESNNRRS